MTFVSPLPEDDRVGLLASLYLTLNDASGRGTWPISEIDIALPCEIASFPVGDDTWVISAGEGLAPPRWARAKGVEETFFLAAGPSIIDARAWAASRSAPIANMPRSTYYLVGVVGGRQFIFKAYQNAPDGKRLADDMFDAITQKTAPIAAYDPGGAAASLFLLTQSRRTSEIYRPERLNGDRVAVVYGPDGYFFAPTPGESVILRGSDLTCDATYGVFERASLSVLYPEDSGLDLSCRYDTEESYMTIFTTHRPDAREDRKSFADAIKSAQADGVAGRLPGFKTGRGEALQAGGAWIDKSRIGQGLWFMRRGEYVYEVRATFTEADSEATFTAAEAFLRSTEPDADAR